MVELFICMNVFWHYSTLIKFALRGNRGFYEAREYLAEVLIEELEEFVDLKNSSNKSRKTKPIKDARKIEPKAFGRVKYLDIDVEAG